MTRENTRKQETPTKPQIKPLTNQIAEISAQTGTPVA